MASRKEQKERLKAERLERERQAESAERRKRLVGYGAGGILVAAVLAALVVVLLAGGDGGSAGGAEPADSSDYPEGSVPAQETAALDEAVEAANCRIRETKEEGNEHVPPGSNVEYEANPPTSGDHFAVPADDGAYTDAPETGALVHSLEHGRVFIQYDPAVPDSVKGDLKALYDEDPYHMIIAPNESGMPYEVAATTWTRALVCEQMNEDVFDAIRAFRDEYRDEGPEFVP